MSRICKKCEGDMYRISTLSVSNVKYEVYQCTACGGEEKICLGVK